jgi:threonine synthase
MLRILRETDGFPMTVGELAIVEAQRLMARVEGIWTAPEAAATLAALLRMIEERQVDAGARIVLILTGSGIKYPPPPLPAPLHLERPEEMLTWLDRSGSPR